MTELSMISGDGHQPLVLFAQFNDQSSHVESFVHHFCEAYSCAAWQRPGAPSASDHCLHGIFVKIHQNPISPLRPHANSNSYWDVNLIWDNCLVYES